MRTPREFSLPNETTDQKESGKRILRGAATSTAGDRGEKATNATRKRYACPPDEGDREVPPGALSRIFHLVPGQRTSTAMPPRRHRRVYNVQEQEPREEPQPRGSRPLPNAEQTQLEIESAEPISGVCGRSARPVPAVRRALGLP